MRWSRYDVGRYHIHASVYVHAFMNTANMLVINVSDSSDTLHETKARLAKNLKGMFFKFQHAYAWSVHNSISYFQSMLTSSFSSTSDPALRRALTTSVFPLLAA